MADKESFAVKLMHAIDRMLAPKDTVTTEPPGPSAEILARRKEAERRFNAPPEEPDDIRDQVELLRRKRKAFSLGTSDEPSL